MSVRPMVVDGASCSGLGMDEPTIDCSVCGAAGYLEVQVQSLDDTANWRLVYRYVMCTRHLDRLHISWPMLSHDSRVIAQRCD